MSGHTPFDEVRRKEQVAPANSWWAMTRNPAYMMVGQRIECLREPDLNLVAVHVTDRGTILCVNEKGLFLELHYTQARVVF